MKKYLLFFFSLILTLSTTFGQTVLILPTGDGGFETGATVGANNWTALNNTDAWVVGATPTPSAGVRCGYVSPDGGTSWTYTQISTIEHIYYTVTIPATQSKLTLNFKWKATGEGTGANDWDNLKVFFAPTSYTPVVNTAVTATYQVGASFYNSSSAAWNVVTGITFTGTPGSTYNLIFSWKSDVSDIVSPPAAIDEVSLTSTTPPPPLSGIKTIDPGGSGPDNYTSFAAAITALNDAGPGPLGVTFNVIPGMTENITSPLLITATATASNPIIFQKNGGGTNPKIARTDAGTI